MRKADSQAILNAAPRPGSWLVVVGAGGGLGHFAGTFPLYSVDLRSSHPNFTQFNTAKSWAPK